MSKQKRLTALITRPLHQATPLAQKIEGLGAKSITLPTITINYLSDHKSLKEAISLLSTSSIAIFLSANAVFACAKEFHKHSHDTKVIAIGPGTAHALRLQNIHVDLIPEEYSSEGLLKLPILDKFTPSDPAVILFCGENSRPFLKNTLTARGANVTEAICYCRTLPQYDRKQLLQLATKNIDVIISTSCESLRNLFTLMNDSRSLNWLSKTPIVIISKRMLETLNSINPHQPYLLAGNASDQAILDSIHTYLNQP